MKKQAHPFLRIWFLFLLLIALLCASLPSRELSNAILVPMMSSTDFAGHTIAAGAYHSVIIQPNGSVFAIGYTDSNRCNVGSWSDIVDIAAFSHTVGLRSDGTVLATGKNKAGQCNVDSWSNIVAIAVNDTITVGLTGDGRVYAVGENTLGRTDTYHWRNIVGIAAGGGTTYGLCADGTVVATGSNANGQMNVGAWNDIVQISAGNNHVVGLRSNGTVVALGNNGYGQCDVSSWRNIVAISAGNEHTVGLKADGTVVAVGRKSEGQCNVSSLRGIVEISAGMLHTMALDKNGIVYAIGSNGYGQLGIDGRSAQLPFGSRYTPPVSTGSSSSANISRPNTPQFSAPISAVTPNTDYLQAARRARSLTAEYNSNYDLVNALAKGFLLDWDNDGVEELFLSYGHVQESSRLPEYEFAIYDFENGSVVTVYEDFQYGASFASAGSHGFSGIIKYRGRTAVVTCSFIEYSSPAPNARYEAVRIRFSILDYQTGKSIHAVEINCADGNTLTYTIDGFSASESEFRSVINDCTNLSFVLGASTISLRYTYSMTPIDQLIEQLSENT